MATATQTNAVAIYAGLEALLAPVDQAWEQSVIDAYLHTAKHQLAMWFDYLSKPEPTRYDGRMPQPKYVKWTSAIATPRKFGVYYDKPQVHVEKAQAAKDGEYSVDTDRATADAKRTYQATRTAFLVRVTEKISYVVQETPVTIVGSITFDRAIEGQVTARLGGDNGITLRVSVKTNYRYGVNSANGDLTVYSQYPATFVGARINDQNVLAMNLSEEMLGHLVSGLALDHKERASRAEIDAKKAKIVERRRLEDLKSVCYDLAHDHDRIVDLELRLRPSAHEPLDAQQRERYEQRVKEYRARIAKDCAKAGIADPGSKAAANHIRKQLLAQIKALKGTK